MPALRACTVCRDLDNYSAIYSNATSGRTAVGPLLPELAQLQRLENLILIRYAAPPWPAFPAEWLAPGAFPSLQR